MYVLKSYQKFEMLAIFVWLYKKISLFDDLWCYNKYVIITYN